MKKITVALSSILMVAILRADIDKDITHAIKKSKPDLLKKYLKEHTLTAKQRAQYLELANEISNIRETKMNINFIKPKRFAGAGSGEHLKAMFLAAFSIFLTGATLEACQKDKGAILLLILVGGLDIYFYKKIKELWLKGNELDIESYKSYRTPKQKYLDSLEIKLLFRN